MIKRKFVIFILLALPIYLNAFTMERIWVAYGDTARRQYGVMASGVGDVNIDGYGDFVITRLHANPLLYYGGNPPDTIPDLELIAPTAYGLKGGYDFNGDDHPDFVLASTEYAFPCGLLYVYFGGPFLSNTPNYILKSPFNSSSGGYSDLKVSNMDISGDINGDGFNDIVVYSYESSSRIQRGTLIYLGGTTMDTLPNYIIQDFGEVLSVGDFNGDGYDDIVVRKVYPSAEVRMYLGNATFDTIPDLQFINEYGPMFAGDLNRDGYEDLELLFNVYAGSSTPDTIRDAGVDGWAGGGYRIGDLNGDGWIDLGSAGGGYGGSWRVYLNNGDIHKLESGGDFIHGGYIGSDYASMGVNPAFDVNDDGRDEIIVFNPADNHNGELSGMVEIWKNAEPVEINEQTKLPEQFEIVSYPNPFNNNVIIKYRLTKPAKVNIRIYNILGQKIDEIIKEKGGIGWNRISWNPNTKQLSSGIYFALVRIDGDAKRVLKLNYLK